MENKSFQSYFLSGQNKFRGRNSETDPSRNFGINQNARSPSIIDFRAPQREKLYLGQREGEKENKSGASGGDIMMRESKDLNLDSVRHGSRGDIEPVY